MTPNNVEPMECKHDAIRECVWCFDCQSMIYIGDEPKNDKWFGDLIKDKKKDLSLKE